MSRAEAMRKLTEEKFTKKEKETVINKSEVKPKKIVATSPAKKVAIKAGERLTKGGQIDKRKNNPGRTRLPNSDDFVNTTVTAHPDILKEARKKFGSLRQALEWAVANKKG